MNEAPKLNQEVKDFREDTKIVAKDRSPQPLFLSDVSFQNNGLNIFDPASKPQTGRVANF
jgi:hypothetical protein